MPFVFYLLWILITMLTIPQSCAYGSISNTTSELFFKTEECPSKPWSMEHGAWVFVGYSLKNRAPWSMSYFLFWKRHTISKLFYQFWNRSIIEFENLICEFKIVTFYTKHFHGTQKQVLMLQLLFFSVNFL